MALLKARVSPTCRMAAVHLHTGWLQVGSVAAFQHSLLLSQDYMLVGKELSATVLQVQFLAA